MTKCLGVLLFTATILYGIPAFGQTADLSGEYANLTHEDAMERAGGPPLGDYLGIPLNEAGRMRADANDVADWGLPEFGCRPHPGRCRRYTGGCTVHPGRCRSVHSRMQGASGQMQVGTQPDARRSPADSGRIQPDAGCIRLCTGVDTAICTLQ